MKALTICNPWPALILLPASDPRHKRVENRTWATQYRGPLLIHAGQSRAYMAGDEDDDLVFNWGYLLGVCELLDCVQLGRLSLMYQHVETVNGQVTRNEHVDRRLEKLVPPEARERFPWLADHPHTEGPVCWVLGNIRKFREPVKCRGAQGLWTVTGVPLVNVRQQLKEAIAV